MTSMSTNQMQLRLAATIFLATFQLLLWLIPSDPFSSAVSNIIPAAFFALLLSAATYLAIPHVWISQAQGPWPGNFRAQVLGIQWLPTPLRHDHTTEWQLLNTLGLLTSGSDEDTIEHQSCDSLRLRAMTSTATDRSEQIDSHAEYIAEGTPVKGYASLELALRYLHDHPDKTAWVMNWKADQPLEEQTRQDPLLIILAGPEYESDQPPLAWICRTATAIVSDSVNAQQAWTSAIKDAVTNAQKITTDIGYLIHDTRRSESAETRALDALAQALRTEVPYFKFIDQSFATPAQHGEADAGTTLLGVALGAAYAHHTDKSVLIASTREPNYPVALMIIPPETGVAIRPAGEWETTASNPTMLWRGSRK